VNSRLTRTTRIKRLRDIATQALNAFGLSDAGFKLTRLAGNALFRVYDPSVTSPTDEDYPYLPGQYLLRIHDPRAQDGDAIKLEMEWLTAIRRDMALPVPEPVRSADGNLLVDVGTTGTADSYKCTLLRWLRGRNMSQNIRPRHFQAQGRIMAQLHNHASAWNMPSGLSKRCYDFDGLFSNDAGAGLPNSEAWELLTDEYRSAYEEVARRVKRVMIDGGKHRDLFGLIHADCGVDLNVLFWRGDAQVIDFDDSGFGYYVYDLAVALEHCWEEPSYPRYLNALLEGYSEFRSLKEKHLREIDLFRSAFYVYMGLWTVAMDETHPDSPNKAHRHEKWLGYGMRFIRRYLEQS
jgi:Ser/Thr protein kinase RdoA (MazF antagonist)